MVNRTERAHRSERIMKAFQERCPGEALPITKAVAVWNLGMQALEEGVDDTELADRIEAYVKLSEPVDA